MFQGSYFEVVKTETGKFKIINLTGKELLGDYMCNSPFKNEKDADKYAKILEDSVNTQQIFAEMENYYHDDSKFNENYAVEE